MDVGPFLKEYVKRKMISLRVLRGHSAGRRGQLFRISPNQVAILTLRLALPASSFTPNAWQSH
jgi:hypothetical protein